LPDMQETKGQESADNCCSLISDPEVAQADWQLLRLVPEREEEDCIGNAVTLLVPGWYFLEGMIPSKRTIHPRADLARHE
jgi:hypothetical protein